MAGYLPNLPETVIAMLAASAVGAVWCSCATDIGPLAAIEMVLLGIFGYAQGILLIYTAACIGHLFPRGRALISVLSFIAMSSVLGEITDLLQELFQQVVGESYGSYSHYMSLLPELVTSVLICIGLFCAVRYVLENRLNLD